MKVIILKIKEEINLAIENERNYWDKLNDYINEISAHCQNLIHDIFMKTKILMKFRKNISILANIMLKIKT